MRAARIHDYGPPDVLRVDEVPDPQPGPRDLLVRVHAASVNPVDYKIRSGGQRALIHYTLPWILGLDFSGEVVAVGSRVTRFAVGDHVYGSPTHRRPGTYAELLCVDERQAARKPRNMSHAEAASIPLVGMTAWGALVVQGRLKAGQKALIHAGSGGVGTFAIQLAKSLGAYVATTCSARNVDLCRSVGADEVIDYNEQRFDEVLKDYDYVLDALGGETRERSFRVLRRGGRLATMIGGFPDATKKHGPWLGAPVALWGLVSLSVRGALRHRVSVHHVLREPDGQLLDPITARIERGDIRAVIDRVLPLAEIAESHRYIETGRARGKIVIDTITEAPPAPAADPAPPPPSEEE
ncbi:MAG: NADP-dependent oxidoreductase [Sandaracinaceae bacterium]|nr:NADP-dependent oxidoreductase [Sandaracinaceae bacterium]